MTVPIRVLENPRPAIATWRSPNIQPLTPDLPSCPTRRRWCFIHRMSYSRCQSAARQCPISAHIGGMAYGTAAKATVRFVSYDTIRNSLSDERGVFSPGRDMLAGMMAGAVESVLAVTPTERIKTALQAHCQDTSECRALLTEIIHRIDGAKGARHFKVQHPRHNCLSSKARHERALP